MNKKKISKTTFKSFYNETPQLFYDLFRSHFINFFTLSQIFKFRRINKSCKSIIYNVKKDDIDEIILKEIKESDKIKEDIKNKDKEICKIIDPQILPNKWPFNNVYLISMNQTILTNAISESFCKMKKPSILQWVLNRGSAVLKTNGFSKDYNLHVSTMQMIFLLQFNQENRIDKSLSIINCYNEYTFTKSIFRLSNLLKFSFSGAKLKNWSCTVNEKFYSKDKDVFLKNSKLLVPKKFFKLAFKKDYSYNVHKKYLLDSSIQMLYQNHFAK